MLPWASASLYSKRHLNRFSRCWASVCKTVRYNAIGPSSCLSHLSVTLVCCGQTVRWIKIKLGTEVGLGPGHVVLGGHPTPSKWARLLWPNSWIDQDATWYGGRPRLREFELDGDPAPPKRGTASHTFRPMSIVAKRLDGSRCHLARR